MCVDDSHTARLSGVDTVERAVGFGDIRRTACVGQAASQSPGGRLVTASETVDAYFVALAAGDADAVIALMASEPHYVKIGTDDGEWVLGADGIDAYFRGVADAASDLRIDTTRMGVEGRGDVAWFHVEQDWRLRWRGTPEQIRMRITGVLERTDRWRFAQIHASVGEG
jgi:ketosteroid isomerase-like protein